MTEEKVKSVTNCDKKQIPVKHLSNDDVKDFILNKIKLPHDIDYLLNKMGTEIIPAHREGSGGVGETVYENVNEIMRGLELETQYGLMEAVDERYRTLVKEITVQTVKEYGCNTSIEKALAEQIANSHVRIIDNSRRLNNELNGQNITSNRNNYIAILSKQLDRAHRQFVTAVFALKQLKQPQMSVSVKATNAFVSQSQEFNVIKKDEIVEA